MRHLNRRGGAPAGSLLGLTGAPLSLAAAVVAAPQRAPLVALTRCAFRPGTGCSPARSTAVAVAAVTMGADPHQLPAAIAREQAALSRSHPQHPWTGGASGRTLGLSCLEGLPDRSPNQMRGAPVFIHLTRHRKHAGWIPQGERARGAARATGAHRERRGQAAGYPPRGGVWVSRLKKAAGYFGGVGLRLSRDHRIDALLGHRPHPARPSPERHDGSRPRRTSRRS